jgi:hypothetical protein
MNIRNRLDRLEGAFQPGAGAAAPAPTLESILTHFEQANDLPAGAISRTPQEAAGKGFSCIADELAALLGMTAAEFKQAIKR